MLNPDHIGSAVRSRTGNVDIETAMMKLLAYARMNGWSGHDPYDALNSPLFRALPMLDRRIPRLVLTQGLKRSVVDFRRVLKIPRTQNPKALALFLSALVRMERSKVIRRNDDINFMIERLRVLRSPGMEYFCWGYSFPWQTRTLVIPSDAPNLVCTTFVADSLLDAYEWGGDSRCLDMALSAVEYIVGELYWAENGAAGFSYPAPSVRGSVHNANLLAASLLCRAYAQTKDERFLVPALAVARYSTSKQQSDGSWLYGEAQTQRWIDNFHTGYNLCALQAISRYAATTEFAGALQRGFEFYRDHFFRADGSVAYFHDRLYPIDVHCVAQSILTLVTLRKMVPGNIPLAHSVLQWALTHLWDDRGFFYYQVLKSCTNRISYMRWSQAWMLLAMAALLEVSVGDSADGNEPSREMLAGCSE